MSEIAFQIGPIAIRWYGILIVVGASLAGWIASRQARFYGEDPDHAWNALLYCLVLGLIGARAYHVIDQWSYYSQNPTQIIAVWRGGIGIYGAIIGGALALYLYARINHLDFVRWADIAAPALILAQAIGRWGNFFNQELYGRPSTLPFPFSIYIDPLHRLAGYEGFERFHPLFLYESVWNLAAFTLLILVSRRLYRELQIGDMALLYGVLYPLGRFLLEGLRINPWTILGIPTAQWISAAAVLFCGGVLLYRHLIAPQAAPATPARMTTGRRRRRD